MVNLGTILHRVRDPNRRMHTGQTSIGGLKEVTKMNGTAASVPSLLHADTRCLRILIDVMKNMSTDQTNIGVLRMMADPVTNTKNIETTAHLLIIAKNISLNMNIDLAMSAPGIGVAPFVKSTVKSDIERNLIESLRVI